MTSYFTSGLKGAKLASPPEKWADADNAASAKCVSAHGVTFRGLSLNAKFALADQKLQHGELYCVTLGFTTQFAQQ